MKPRQIIVDENDQIIGHKFREEIVQTDIYRVAALWITNSKGDILLARRALSKKTIRAGGDQPLQVLLMREGLMNQIL